MIDFIQEKYVPRTEMAQSHHRSVM